MKYKEIQLSEIDLQNETFRISEELDTASVLESLREIGQLNPVVLLDAEPLKTIVCGFRRIRAIARLGGNLVIARILACNDCDTTAAFMIALWDNLSHRQLDPLEKARVLHKLRDMSGLKEDSIISDYLPLLGLAPNRNVLRSYMQLNGIHHDLRRCLIDGRLTQSSLEYLAEMPVDIQKNVASLMGRIRLSASLQRKVLHLLDELSAISGKPFDSLLSDLQIQAVLEDANLSSFQKGEKLYESLYRIRYPRLSNAEDRFSANRRSLPLPGSIRIMPRPFFEDPGLRVEFDAPDIERFRQLASALHEAAQLPAAERLFALE